MKTVTAEPLRQGMLHPDDLRNLERSLGTLPTRDHIVDYESRSRIALVGMEIVGELLGGKRDASNPSTLRSKCPFDAVVVAGKIDISRFESVSSIDDRMAIVDKFGKDSGAAVLMELASRDPYYPVRVAAVYQLGKMYSNTAAAEGFFHIRDFLLWKANEKGEHKSVQLMAIDGLTGFDLKSRGVSESVEANARAGAALIKRQFALDEV